MIFKNVRISLFIGLFFWIFSFSLQAQERCSSLFFDASFYSEMSRQEIQSLPNSEKIEQIVSLIKRESWIADLYEAPNGGKNDPSIEEHSFKVYEQYLKQTQNKVQNELMLYAIALHDIGKPLAIANKERNQQLKYTLPLTNEILLNYGFKENEIKLITSIIKTDAIARFLKKEISAVEAFSILKHEASENGLSVSEYYSLKKNFFIADSGYYKSLRIMVYYEFTDGSLGIKSPRIQDLEKLLP